MECGKLTAKLRDAVPVCFIESGKEVKRYKNIEIPDEIKRLPFSDFKFDVPANGAITFKIMFEPGVLPTEWPEARQRKSRSATSPSKAEISKAIEESINHAAEEGEPVREFMDAAKRGAEVVAEISETADGGHEIILTAVDADEDQQSKEMELAYHVTGDERRALVAAVSTFTGEPAVYQRAPSYAFAIGDYMVDRNGTLSGPHNDALITALQAKNFIAE